MSGARADVQLCSAPEGCDPVRPAKGSEGALDMFGVWVTGRREDLGGINLRATRLQMFPRASIHLKNVDADTYSN